MTELDSLFSELLEYNEESILPKEKKLPVEKEIVEEVEPSNIWADTGSINTTSIHGVDYAHINGGCISVGGWTPIEYLDLQIEIKQDVQEVHSFVGGTEFIPMKREMYIHAEVGKKLEGVESMLNISDQVIITSGSNEIYVAKDCILMDTMSRQYIATGETIICYTFIVRGDIIHYD